MSTPAFSFFSIAFSNLIFFQLMSIFHSFSSWRGLFPSSIVSLHPPAVAFAQTFHRIPSASTQEADGSCLKHELMMVQLARGEGFLASTQGCFLLVSHLYPYSSQLSVLESDPSLKCLSTVESSQE